jgi:hypothetical protein
MPGSTGTRPAGGSARTPTPHTCRSSWSPPAGRREVRAIDAGADDFINKPLDQASCSAGALPAAGQAVPRHGRRAGGRARRWNESWRPVAAQVERLERYGALRRFFSRRSPGCCSTRATTRSSPATGGDHRRVLRPARFTAFAETSDPRRSCRSSPRTTAPSATWSSARGHPGALRRRRPAGLLQRPGADPRRAARAVRMAVQMREAVAELAVGWHRLGLRPRVRVGSRAASRRSAGSGSRAATTTAPSAP